MDVQKRSRCQRIEKVVRTFYEGDFSRVTLENGFLYSHLNHPLFCCPSLLVTVTPSTHPVKSTLLYSIAVYAGISVSVGIAGSDLIEMLSDGALTTDQRVLDLELTIQLVAHLLTPILWIDSHCQSDGFDAWASLTVRKLIVLAVPNL